MLDYAEKATTVARTLGTRTRYGLLARVFPNDADRDLHDLGACLCVLSEDLRLEIAGIAATDLERLDACGTDARSLYFQRRSIATLHEFATTFAELDKLPSFQPIKPRFNVIAQRHWAHAVDYFSKYER